MAGEAVVRLGKSFTLGGGGWYNKVGRVTYDFNVQTYNGSLVGGGIYNKKGDTETSQRSPDDQKVFSGFVTGRVDVYKGLGVDGRGTTSINCPAGNALP